MSNTQFIWGLGRRKTAVARVRLSAGAGGVLINNRPIADYFPNLQMQERALQPLRAAGVLGNYDVLCAVDGGGLVGQSDAICMGLARALKSINPGFDVAFKEGALLTRDSRRKERKKYGRRGARRGFQFSKR